MEFSCAFVSISSSRERTVCVFVCVVCAYEWVCVCVCVCSLSEVGVRHTTWQAVTDLPPNNSSPLCSHAVNSALKLDNRAHIIKAKNLRLVVL